MVFRPLPSVSPISLQLMFAIMEFIVVWNGIMKPSTFGFQLPQSSKRLSFLKPSLIPSAMTLPRPFQSLASNAALIFAAHWLMASIVLLPDRSKLVSMPSNRPPKSPRPPPPPPPAPPPPPLPAESVSLASWFSSSNGRTCNCFLRFLAAFPALPRLSAAPPAPSASPLAAPVASSRYPAISSDVPLAA